MTLIVRHTDVLGGYEPGKGGGIVGGFNPLNPFRGWRVYSVFDYSTDAAGVENPVIWFRQASGPTADTVQQVHTRLQSAFVDRTWPMGGGFLRGSYPGFSWTFLDPATLAVVAQGLLPVGDSHLLAQLEAGQQNTSPFTGPFVQWFEATPPAGPYIGIMTKDEPSEDFPLWVSGHPVEIVADRLAAKGEAYDAATATAVQASLGAELQHQMAVTDTEESPQDVIDKLAEAYGFAVRRSTTTGNTEFVHWREKVSTLPTPTLTIDDLREEGGPTFDLSDSTRLTRVKVSGQVITPWQPGTVMVPTFKYRRFLGINIGRPKTVFVPRPALLSTDKPASGLMITNADATFDYSTDGVTPDSDTYGESVAEIDVGGQPGLLNTVAGGSSAFNFEQWAAGIARMLFASHARGRQTATVVALRGTDADDVGIGDAITLDLTHLPNAQLGQTPTSQRGGPRPFRVIAATPAPLGQTLVCVDEGTGVQYATVPTITVTPDDEQATNDLLVVTVGNADDLTADGAQVEFQVRAFADGDTVDLTDPGLRYTVEDANQWTMVAQPIRFGPFPDGHTIYVRARAWLVDSAASDWSSWWSIGGEVTGPQTTLSDLRIAPTDDGAVLRWSYDESPPVGSVKVKYRLSGGGAYTTFSTLAAGTETETLTGLSADTAYDVQIVLDNSGEYGDVLDGTFRTLDGAISGLTVGTPTSASVTLSWSNSNSSALVRVQLKLDTETVYWTVVDLPAGSTDYRLTGLTAETDYDVRVVLVVGGSEVGTALTDSFLTDLVANQATLTTPTGAAVFGGWNAALGIPSPGTYGLEVAAVFGPPDLLIVFEEATETAVGSGTPGSYAVVLTTTAVVGGVTRYQANAANDGKLRYLRAYATATGYTDSATTTALSVNPWAATPTVPVAVLSASELIASQTFGRRTDLSVLRQAALQTYLNMGGAPAATDFTDANNIIANQVFGA